MDAQNARRGIGSHRGLSDKSLALEKVGSRLSAGRVQSVALRLIVEREEAITDLCASGVLADRVVDLQKKGVKDIFSTI